MLCMCDTNLKRSPLNAIIEGTPQLVNNEPSIATHSGYMLVIIPPTLHFSGKNSGGERLDLLRRQHLVFTSNYQNIAIL